MQITEYLCDTRPKDSEIQQFEQRIGSTLPADYRNFLIANNGGRPNPSAFSFTTCQGKHEDSSVHYFFGIHDGRIGSLEGKAVLRGQRIPTDFLPIATDAFGNLILIGLGSQNQGKVYFWDHEQEEDEPSLRNISEIAETFAGFVNALSE